MSKSLQLALLLLLLSTLLGIFALCPEIAMQGIIAPIASVAWALWRLIASVDQQVYWAGVIILCVGAMILLIPADSARVSRSAYPEEREPSTRVEYWQALLKHTGSGRPEEAALRQNLMNLIASTLDREELKRQGEPVALLQSKLRGLPPEAQRYLFHEGESSQPLRLRMPRWLRRRDVSDYNAIDEILGWMEEALEIRHDE